MHVRASTACVRVSRRSSSAAGRASSLCTPPTFLPQPVNVPSRINARRQRAMADFSTPVAQHLWEQMADAVSALNTFVRDTGVTAQTGVMQQTTTQWALWPASIERATTSLHTRNRRVAAAIMRELNSVPQELTQWSPKRAYPQRQEVQQKITVCCGLVQTVLDYCTTVSTASSLAGNIAQCELSTELVGSGFSDKTALEICRGLGAVLKRHLLYIDENDVAANPTLKITSKEKKSMCHFAKEYQDKNRLVLAPGIDARLAQMRRMLGP